MLAAVPVVLLLVVVSLLVFAGGKDAPNQVAAGSAVEQQKEEARKLARQRDSEDRAIRRFLNDSTFIASGGGQRREVALTFDDGPGPATSKILDILAETGTPATFFVVGTSVPKNEKILRRVAREGHAIGNHTMEHPPMGSLDLVSQGEQITGQEDEVEQAGVENRPIFRPPYRSFNQATLDLLRERDELMVLWSVDTNDYGNPGTDAIVQAILNDSKPGSIILMHDAGGDRQQTVDALPKIIRGLKQKGLRPVTIPQMVLRDPPLNPDPVPEGL